MKTRIYGTSSVQAWAQGRIAVGVVSGIVTPAEAQRIISDSPKWGDCRPLAHVADYRQATMAIHKGDMLSTAIRAQARGVALSPCALVATGEQLALFSDYCRASNSAGVLRAVFSTADDALRWASRQALVREHWQARMFELQSTP